MNLTYDWPQHQGPARLFTVPKFLRRVWKVFTLRQRLHEIESRLTTLEQAFDEILVSPRYVPGGTAGFNGQGGRKQLFVDLVRTIPFDAMVETGTFFGDTAGFMHEVTKLPVYTCEVNRRLYLVARTRLSAFPRITLAADDSRTFLQSLVPSLSSQTVFFYLDAHWYKDLPLVKEIEIIAKHWQHYVIMIDDFEVPGDSGYSFDIYGKTALSFETIADQCRVHDLIAYFPVLDSRQETGWKRGCIVLVRRGDLLGDMISHLGLLREMREI